MREKRRSLALRVREPSSDERSSSSASDSGRERGRSTSGRQPKWKRRARSSGTGSATNADTESDAGDPGSSSGGSDDDGSNPPTASSSYRNVDLDGSDFDSDDEHGHGTVHDSEHDTDARDRSTTASKKNVKVPPLNKQSFSLSWDAFKMYLTGYCERTKQVRDPLAC